MAILLVQPQRFVTRADCLRYDPNPHPSGETKREGRYWSLEEALLNQMRNRYALEERRWAEIADAEENGDTSNVVTIFPPSHRNLWTLRVARRYVETLPAFMRRTWPEHPKHLIVFMGALFKPFVGTEGVLMHPFDPRSPSVSAIRVPSMSQGNRLWNDPKAEEHWADTLQPILAQFR